MNIADKLQGLGLKSAIIVDDAYELPRPEHLTAEHRGLFLTLVQDDAAAAASLKAVFPDLDPEVDAQVTALLATAENLQKIWQEVEGNAAAYGWCRPVFAGYEGEVNPKRDPLKPLEDYLATLKIPFKTYAEWHGTEDTSDVGLVFVDFFLGASTNSVETALERSTAVARDFVDRRGDSPAYRPLVFLISSRSQFAREVQEKFRKMSSIRGSFFRFLDKSELEHDTLNERFERTLSGYEPGMLLDNYLQTFEEEAMAAVGQLRELELTDLSLLHWLRIEQENEKLGHYLNWLLTESISGGIQSSERLHKAALKLDRNVNHPLDGHDVDPRNLLFEIYTNAVFRYDVRDRESFAMRPEVAFGDIFVEQTTEERVRHRPSRFPRRAVALSYQRRRITRYLAVITPSSDLLRQEKADFPVLCAVGTAIGDHHTDIRSLLKLERDRGSKQSQTQHILRSSDRGVGGYRVIEWERKGSRSVPLHELKHGRHIRRVARMQLLFAHELKQQCLQDIGRVGVPTRPTVVCVLEGTVTLKLDSGTVVIKTRDRHIFAGILANKRVQSGQKEMLCLSMAFLAEIRRRAAEALPAAEGTQKTNLQHVIGVCEGPAEYDVTNKTEFYPKTMIKFEIVRLEDKREVLPSEAIQAATAPAAQAPAVPEAAKPAPADDKGAPAKPPAKKKKAAEEPFCTIQIVQVA